MVPIVKNLVSPDRYGLKCPYPMTPTRIVVHNTGMDAPAKNEVAYMIRNDSEVGFHAAVDDVEIVQGIPFNRNAWGSGDGNGKGNREGIHIEICYSASGGPRFIKAEQNAAQYIASLLKEYGWGIGQVTKHQDYNGKYCPHRTLDMGWGRFLDMVKKYMKEDDNMEYKQFAEYMERYKKEQAAKPAADWAESKIKAAKEYGIMSGDGKGKFRPQSDISRQEVAAVAVAIMSKVKKMLGK